MISINSKSYPYLAVAQWYEKPYGEVLKMTREELRGWQVAAEATASKVEDIKIDNSNASEIWNAAIEKAAKQSPLANYVANKIRKLKV